MRLSGEESTKRLTDRVEVVKVIKKLGYTTTRCEQLVARYVVANKSSRDYSLQRLLVAVTTSCATSRRETTRCSDNS